MFVNFYVPIAILWFIQASTNMKAKELLNIGFKQGPVIGLLLAAEDSAKTAGISFIDRKATARGLFSDPQSHREDAHFGTAAQLWYDILHPEETYKFSTGKPLAIWGEENIEEQAIEQMKRSMEIPPTVLGALMPDAHFGYGIPIGGVLALDNAVMPFGVGVDIACFSGDTKIPLMDYKEYTLRELSERNSPFPVFACKPDGKIVVVHAHCIKTKTDAPLVKVTLDNDKSVTCTPDHEFMLRDGTFCAAKDLSEGQSLMPFNWKQDKEGYVRVQQNYSGAWLRLHWVAARSGLLGKIARFDGQRTIIHHKDFDSTNNLPENLEFMGDRDHSAYHRSLVDRNTHWQSAEFEQKRIKALKEKAQTPEGHKYFADRGRKNFRAYWDNDYDRAKQNCHGNGQRGKGFLVARNQSPEGRALSKSIALRKHKCDICGEEVRSYIGLYNHRKWKHGITGKLNNHQVISVTSLDKTEAVYCLVVPEYHNFALAAGVFVHNCRMMLSVLPLDVDQIDKREDDFRNAIEKHSRFGLGAAFQRSGRRQHDVMDRDWSIIDGIVDKDTAWKQLGSSGGGNHFIDIGEIEFTGQFPGDWIPKGKYVAILTHSGSRGMGSKIANHFTKVAMAKHPLLPPEFKRLAWLSLDDEDGQAYWEAMQLAGHYASANHHCIHRHLLKELGLETLFQVENHHNFAWKEMHNGKEVIVHRKGATPAGEGVLGIIPGSMATPGYLVLGKGKPESLNSAAHGAGRAMSRKAAKEKYRWASVKDQLKHSRVKLISGGIDEVPGAYKDIRTVMKAQEDLVEVIARFDPRLVKMADDGYVED